VSGIDLFYAKPGDLHEPAALRSLIPNQIPVGDAGINQVINESRLLMPQKFSFIEPPMN
jgi:hypothetical protein